MVISPIHPPAVNPFALLLGGRADAAGVEPALSTPNPVMGVTPAVIAIPVLFRPLQQLVQFLLGELFLLRLGLGLGLRLSLGLGRLSTHHGRPRLLGSRLHFGCCGGGRHSGRGLSIVRGT